jgi:hypothetical protein
VLLAACGKDEASTSPSATATAAPAPTPAPAASVAPAATASATAAATAAPAAGGACSFAGEWTGTYPPGPYPFSGTPFEFSFKADGTGITKSMRADSEFAWKVEGGTFSIHGTKINKGGRFSCSKEEVGKWGFAFTPDCSGVTFKIQQDPCKGRAKTMDGASMKRK